jgi:hypothetical protein
MNEMRWIKDKLLEKHDLNTYSGYDLFEHLFTKIEYAIDREKNQSNA